MYASDYPHGESLVPRVRRNRHGLGPASRPASRSCSGTMRSASIGATRRRPPQLAARALGCHTSEATAGCRSCCAGTDRVLAVMDTPSAGLAQDHGSGRCRGRLRRHAGIIGAVHRPGGCGRRQHSGVREIGGWIARAVRFPVILDGDTGHGGIMAVRTPGARLHRSRTRRRPHRRPGDRGQTRHHHRRHRSSRRGAVSRATGRRSTARTSSTRTS